jgi:hypothetical protein
MSPCRAGWRLLYLCPVFAGLAGCGGGGVQRCAVSGNVKVAGKPLDQGAIVFTAQDASLGSGGGDQIKNGQYSIPAQRGLLPGRYRVSITSALPGAPPDPNAPPGPAGPMPKDRIDPKYNALTTLTAEVKADGPNVFDFEVD